MEEEWVCPKCETVNKGKSQCIVCGFAYSDALKMKRKREAPPVPPPPISHRELKPSEIKLRFRDLDKESEPSREESMPSNALAICACIALILNCLGILLGIFAPQFGIFLSFCTIITGIIALKKEMGGIAAAAVALGIVMLFVSLATMMIR